MIEVSEILQTIRMVSEQHFDIRTITMGISLLDCKKNTDRETAQAVYDKVTRPGRRDSLRCAWTRPSLESVASGRCTTIVPPKPHRVTPVRLICGTIRGHSPWR